MPRADTHPRGLRASGRKCARKSSQVRRTTGIRCAMVYGVWRDLPGGRALIVPVTLRNVSQGLTSASGGQDHALWLVRIEPASSGASRHVHRIPPPTSVTIAIRPLVAEADARIGS